MKSTSLSYKTIAALLLVSLAFPTPFMGVKSQNSSEIITVVSSTTRDFVFDYHIQPENIEIHEDTVNNCSQISISEHQNYYANGYPLQPSFSQIIGVPDSSSAKVVVDNIQYATIDGIKKLCPSDPPVELPSQPGSSLPPVTSMPVFNNPAPDQPAAIIDHGFLRDLPFVQLGIFPFSGQTPANGHLQYIAGMRVQVTFGSPGRLTKINRPQSADFQNLVDTTIVNADIASQWIGLQPTLTRTATFLSHVPRYKIELNSEGLYQITYSDLVASGLPIDQIDPRNIHIYHNASEIPIIVQGQTDGIFNTTDTILFYWKPELTQFARYITLYLDYDDIAGLRISETSLAPATNPQPSPSHWRLDHYETDTFYNGRVEFTPTHDHWFWNSLTSTSSAASLTIPVEVHNLADSGGIVRLSGQIKGYSAVNSLANSINQHILVSVNGHLVLDTQWEATGQLDFMVEFPSGHISSGSNNIVITSPGETGTTRVLLFNYLNLEYPSLYPAINDQLLFSTIPGDWIYSVTGFSSPDLLLFDVSQADQPMLLTNYQIIENGPAYDLTYSSTMLNAKRLYATTVNQAKKPSRITATNDGQLLASTNAADYIIITPALLKTAADDLAAYRANQGLRTKVVDIQAIYDAFAGGLPDPNGIRTFLTYAYQNWTPPAPLYVLLLGDGHYDYRMLTPTVETNLIPPLLGDYDPWLLEIPSDSRMALVNGDDTLPDLYIGRISVRNLTEANQVISKIKTYEGQSPAAWHKKAFLIADNPDDAGDFTHSSQLISSALPASYAIEYLNFNPATMTAAAARNTIINRFSAGVGLINYAGHGAIGSWAAEQLLRRADVATLSSTTYYPFLVTLDCMDGFFSFPNQAVSDNSSIIEMLVRASMRGPVAAFSPTGWGLVDGHDILATGLYEAIFSHGLNRAGAATTYAKYYLASHTNGHKELIDSYSLFGDPALLLKLGPDTPPAPSDLTIQLSLPDGPGKPGDLIDIQLNFFNQGSTPAENISIDLILPTTLLSPTFTLPPSVIQSYTTAQRYRFQLLALNPGQSSQITIHTQIDPTSLGQILVEATITSVSQDSDHNNNSTSIYVSRIPPPDLTLTISSPTPAPLEPGHPFQIVLNYANVGLGDANIVSLSLPLPPTLESYTLTEPTGWSLLEGSSITLTTPTIPPGGSGSILIEAVLSSTVTGPFDLTATIGSSCMEDDSANNTASLSRELLQPADLSVVYQLLTSGYIFPGDSVEIVAGYANTGSSTAHLVSLDFGFPTQLIDIVVTPPVGWIQDSIIPTTYTTSVLAPGQTGAFTVTAKIDNSFIGAMKLTTNISSVDPDQYLVNNSSALYLGSTPPPDLSLSLESTTAEPLEPGHSLNATLTYTNMGTGDAENVSLTLTLPTALSDVIITLPEGWVAAGPTPYTYTTALIPSGSGSSITIEATLNPQVSGTFAISAEISNTNPDPDPNNDTAAIQRELLLPADLSIAYDMLPPGQVYPDQTVQLRLTYTNFGQSTAHNVAVSLFIPDTLTDIAISPPAGWTASGLQNQYTTTGLAPGSSGSFIINARIRLDISSSTFTPSAEITTVDPEPDLINNNASLQIVTRFRVLIPVVVR